jgi:lipopolysaccharide/colanic/teichoic acid biosynthesis glycosyltransferase
MRYKLVKRILDILLALFIIILSLPLQIFISLCLIFFLKGNPFYFQKRGISKNRPLFTIFKFRTINLPSAIFEEHKHSKDIFLLPDHAVEIKSFAKWLRRTGLDELPQVYNVLIGQMNIVGPRPLMIRDLEIMEREFPNHYNLRSSISVKPGITGVWQIIGDRNLGVENLVGLDIFYQENYSFRLDFKILLSTIPIVLFAKNSDAIIPRIDFIKKFFSLSIGEFSLNHNRISSAEKLKAELSKTYKLKIPLDWWYVNNSYSNADLEHKLIVIKDLESEEKILISNKLKTIC